MLLLRSINVLICFSLEGLKVSFPSHSQKAYFHGKTGDDEGIGEEEEKDKEHREKINK